MFVVPVQDGAQEAPATPGGGRRHPTEQHTDLPQNPLPQRHGGGTSTDSSQEQARANIPTVTPVIPLVPLQIFEVATNTRIRDLTQNITKKLELASGDGFSIFVKTHDKVHLTFLNA